MTPTAHPATLPIDQLLTNCDVIRQRRGGPGGQHRNKVETAIRLTHRPTGVTAEANERRSQSANHTAALFRLRVTLAIAVRHRPLAEEPTPLWQSRCRQGRVSINPTHDDFPSLLAEALDCLAAYDWSIQKAADHLGSSISQLVKLLRHDHRALARLNDERADRDLSPLR